MTIQEHRDNLELILKKFVNTNRNNENLKNSRHLWKMQDNVIKEILFNYKRANTIISMYDSAYGLDSTTSKTSKLYISMKEQIDLIEKYIPELKGKGNLI